MNRCISIPAIVARRARRSEGRCGLFDGEYRRRAWEGHFARYREHEGMRIPMYGEVGWYGDEGLKLVWRGRITDVTYHCVL